MQAKHVKIPQAVYFSADRSVAVGLVLIDFYVFLWSQDTVHYLISYGLVTSFMLHCVQPT